MLHSRTYSVTNVEDPAELAAKLTSQTWGTCTGFRHRGYLWLNDSISECGVQEYVVVRESDGMQVESITVSWSSPDRLAAMITEASDGEYDESPWAKYAADEPIRLSA